MLGFTRDERGWKVKTRFLTFHPVSYGTATLARLSFGLTPNGRHLMFHYFPKADYSSSYHDHPWHFRTLVLLGSYIDESFTPDGLIVTDRLHAGRYRYRHAHHRHRTRVPRFAITVVLTGPTEREWCEGDISDWKCGGQPADFQETLGHIPNA